MKKKIELLIRERAVQKETLTKQSGMIEAAVKLIVTSYLHGCKVIIAGNGGSAADSQHIAGELVGRFLKNRKSLPAIALSTDTSVITSISNDFGFQDVFARQIQAHAKKGDVLWLISTSGNSPNIINALTAGLKSQCNIITLTGTEPNCISPKGHVNICVPGKNSPEIQENHTTVYHIICQLVEEKLFEK